MIRATLHTDKGPVGLVGISEENLRRMKAGMPLVINLQEITPPGTRMNRLVVHYAVTYEQAVDEMVKGGLPVEELRKPARDLDEQVKQERREANRG